MSHKCFEDMKENLHANFEESLAELINWRTGKISGYGLRITIVSKTKTGKDKKKKTWIKFNFCPFCGENLRDMEEIFKEEA